MEVYYPNDTINRLCLGQAVNFQILFTQHLKSEYDADIEEVKVRIISQKYDFYVFNLLDSCYEE